MGYIGTPATGVFNLGDDTVTPAKLSSAFINGMTDTVITASDEITFGDVTDSNDNKKDTVQGILDLVPATSFAVDTSFLAYLTIPTSLDKTGDSTAYAVNDVGWTEIFDLGSDFDSVTGGTFTAPATGKYLLYGQVSGILRPSCASYTGPTLTLSTTATLRTL